MDPDFEIASRIQDPSLKPLQPLYVNNLGISPCNYDYFSQDGAKSVLSQSSDTPEDHVEYWHSLQEFVLQGRMDQVCQLKMVIGYLLKLVEIGSKLVKIG